MFFAFAATALLFIGILLIGLITAILYELLVAAFELIGKMLRKAIDYIIYNPKIQILNYPW